MANMDEHNRSGKPIASRQTEIPVINPATGEIIDSVPNGGQEEAKKAVDTAYDAFSLWSKKTAAQRSELLMGWHKLIEENKQEIAEIMTLEQGKPLSEALGEVGYANSFVLWFAEEGKRIYGETIPASHENKRIIVLKQPVGVVAAITPWNFPAAMITRKVAPALAAGCTVVVKPAEQTPLTALKLVELAGKAGIPKGVLTVITGDAQEIGETWLQDQRVRKITFTGSTEVGKLLMRGAAETVKKVSLELGGHAPLIVFEDADLDKAVAGAIASKFRNAGQTCVCANRIYVQETISEEFIQKFTSEVKKLKIGNGLEEGTQIGPLIDQDALTKVETHIADAIEKGGIIAVGGSRVPADGGHFFEPTILINASEDMLCMKEETFGPLAPITLFKTAEEAIQRANNSVYGLAAYVFTENINKAIYTSEKLEYGIVGLNDGVPSIAQAPFGGYKQSGLGREGGHQGIEEFLETKYISISLS
jgi:succinate-semialdehyde dehydrogenase/glutarate-semialdehyde dehydrogenase